MPRSQRWSDSAVPPLNTTDGPALTVPASETPIFSAGCDAPADHSVLRCARGMTHPPLVERMQMRLHYCLSLLAGPAWPSCATNSTRSSLVSTRLSVSWAAAASGVTRLIRSGAIRVFKHCFAVPQHSRDQAAENARTGWMRPVRSGLASVRPSNQLGLRTTTIALDARVYTQYILK